MSNPETPPPPTVDVRPEVVLTSPNSARQSSPFLLRVGRHVVNARGTRTASAPSLGFYLLCCFRAGRVKRRLRRNSATALDEQEIDDDDVDGTEDDNDVDQTAVELTSYNVTVDEIETVVAVECDTTTTTEKTYIGSSSSVDLNERTPHNEIATDDAADAAAATDVSDDASASAAADTTSAATMLSGEGDGENPTLNGATTDRICQNGRLEHVTHRSWSSATSSEAEPSFGAKAGLQDDVAVPCRQFVSNHTTTTTSSVSSSNEMNDMAIVARGENHRVDSSTSSDFDASDLNGVNDVITQCGRCNVTVRYFALDNAIDLTIHETRDLPTGRSATCSSYGTRVHVLLLPGRLIRHRTKLARDAGVWDCGDDVQRYEETFRFPMTLAEIGSSTFRIRVYFCEKLRQSRIIGECLLNLAGLGLDVHPTATVWLTLEPRSNIPNFDSLSDMDSLSDVSCPSSPSGTLKSGRSGESISSGRCAIPKLLLGLKYAVPTGRLTVVILKGSGIRLQGSSKAQDTYVKLTLTDEEGRELARGCTSVVPHQVDPVYRETFVFRTSRSCLVSGAATLLVSVHARRLPISSRTTANLDSLIGWFSLGCSSSGEEQRKHWDELIAPLSVASAWTSPDMFGTPIRTPTSVPSDVITGTETTSTVNSSDATDGSLFAPGTVDGDSIERWHQLLEP